MAAKYQIFVSSTFADLQEERQVVSRSILELNHIPAGMELFPAFDQSQLDFIKRVIDDCDYYLLIIGGKYGSTTEDGISFTEAEYDYAVEKGKPVVALLHSDLAKIPHGKVESDGEKSKKLETFRKKVSSNRLVKFWTSKDDLKSNAIISLTSSFDQNPQIGWRRGDDSQDTKWLKRIEDIRARSEMYRERYTDARSRLKAFEDFSSSEVEIKYMADSEPRFIQLDSVQLIREFAAALRRGFEASEAHEIVYQMIEHKHDSEISEVVRESIENLLLFFEVYEVAETNEIGDLELRDGMLFLLKSAFRKQQKPKTSSSLDDEIPF